MNALKVSPFYGIALYANQHLLALLININWNKISQ